MFLDDINETQRVTGRFIEWPLGQPAFDVEERLDCLVSMMLGCQLGEGLASVTVNLCIVSSICQRPLC